MPELDFILVIKNMFKTLQGLLLVLYFNFSFGQSPEYKWSHSYSGYSAPVSFSEDTQGNILVFGTFFGSTDFDPSSNNYSLQSGNFGSFFIQKMDSLGNLIWVKKIDQGGSVFGGYEHIGDVGVDQSGNIYLTSIYRYSVDFDPNSTEYFLNSSINASGNQISNLFLLKITPSGDFAWVKSWSIENLEYLKHEVYVDDQSKVYLVGDLGFGPVDLNPGSATQIFTPFASPAVTNFVLKLDDFGNYVEAFVTPVNSYQFDAQKIQNTHVDNLGNIYCGGFIQSTVDIDPTPSVLNISPSGNSDGIFVKYGSNGQVIWHKELISNNISSCSVNKIISSTDGNIFIFGFFEGSIDFDPSQQSYFQSSTGSFFCAKYTSVGDFLWVRTFFIENQSDFEYQNIQILNNGGVLLSMNLDDYDVFDANPGPLIMNYFSPSFDFYGLLVILNENGDYDWSYQYLSIGDEIAVTEIFNSSSGDFFVGGFFGGQLNVDPLNVEPPLITNSSSEGFVVKYSYSSMVGINENQFISSKVVKIFDLLGRETTKQDNQIQFYQYENGTTEKVFIVQH
jgi:hypothetical protein